MSTAARGPKPISPMKLAQELIAEAEAGRISAQEVPTLRAQLCRFDDRDSVLVLTVHHSVSDGWSLQVILRDLGASYAARSSGLPPRLPAVRLAPPTPSSVTSTLTDPLARAMLTEARDAPACLATLASASDTR